MNKKKGVTLVELLIVVLILAALSAIAIPRISQSAANAKANACATNIDVLNSAIEIYNVENEDYPTNLVTITGDTDLFPDGTPVCPVTDAVYPSGLTANDRVDATAHGH